MEPFSREIQNDIRMTNLFTSEHFRENNTEQNIYM